MYIFYLQRLLRSQRSNQQNLRKQPLRGNLRALFLLLEMSVLLRNAVSQPNPPILAGSSSRQEQSPVNSMLSFSSFSLMPSSRSKAIRIPSDMSLTSSAHSPNVMSPSDFQIPRHDSDWYTRLRSKYKIMRAMGTIFLTQMSPCLKLIIHYAPSCIEI